MIPSPTFEESHRWTMPTTAFTNGTATMPKPKRVRYRTSRSSIATSRSSRIRMAGMTETVEMTTMVARIPASPRL